jgi:hypothetical protein
MTIGGRRHRQTSDVRNQPVDNEGSQGSISFNQRFAPPAQLIGSGGVERRVAPARQPVAQEFG